MQFIELVNTIFQMSQRLGLKISMQTNYANTHA